MGGLINSTENKAIKDQKPTLRIFRNFPFLGKKTVMLYFPKSVGAGFSYLPLASIYDSHVSVVRVAEAENAEGIANYAVRSSARPDPIIVMKTEEEAAEVVRLLSSAIAPKRMKWVWWTLGAVVVVGFLSSFGGGGGRSPSAAPALSIHTPLAPRAVAPGASGLATPAPSVVAPSAAPAVSSPAALPAAKTTDVNDPFGLKLAPETAK